MTDNHDRTGASVTVRLTPQGDAYAIYLDGADKPAGATYFIEAGDDRIFFHTTVGDEYAGRGLAGILVDRALSDTRARGKTVVPVCPYVRTHVEKTAWDGPWRTPTAVDLAVVSKHTEGGTE